MKVYTHRRWNKKSILYYRDIKKIKKPLTSYQKKSLLNNGRVKLFLKISTLKWYKASNIHYGPHVWILKDPLKLPPISNELINFTGIYYKEVRMLLDNPEKYVDDPYYFYYDAKKKYKTLEDAKINYYNTHSHFLGTFPYYPKNKIRGLIDPPPDADIEKHGMAWDDEFFVDAVRNEFGVLGFKLKTGAAIINPLDTPTEYYFDYDEKEFTNKKYKRHMRNEYDIIIYEPKYQNTKIEK